ncbi:MULTISPECIES: ATP-binding protein [Bradyrhizobium]|uniref:ATP-binding protein n=1 Tax=Bradyrhizobium TaxID=374 RepID=UPI00155E9186|nr:MULTISPECIES: ATP-binding protein [Bradyrhizobium]MDD1517593.1 hypothetical protein [Bradyrhizobium sp. WBAH30]MDD1541902.1 hypothetical protein [Bradyrhizobium sp. WBAH41]MDD1555232.1 hypothetical protein [Bradyrhizobium sp. WBAH23]MDD1564063.1 hypothetical protein [Bradyrhizobium sp. WBAH33]MDD1587657.1 hypothetical protein [Bradyrhizobium sp. WBAH42]
MTIVEEAAADIAFGSFVELQQANLALLEEKAGSAGGTAGAESQSGKVRRFIRRAVATGTILKRSSERKAAQAAIDYWTTTQILSREYSRAEPETPKGAMADATAPPTVPILANFDPDRASGPTDTESKISPYKGLDPFTQGDAGDYFGREDAAEELQKRVEGDQSVILLLGPSGSGKSSLINAGLLPRLRDRGFKVVVVSAPGREPLAAILRAIKPGADMSTIRADERDIVKSPKKLNEVLTAVDPKAVLVVDQFGEALARTDVQPSLDIVGQALASLAGHHKLLISIRESQRLQFEKIAGIGQAARSPANCFSLPPPSVYELRSMIEGPAERVGLRFGDGVVEDLVRSVAGNPDALPLLQFTLNKLWDNKDRGEITQAVYRKIGSPRDALTSTAETVLQQFSAYEKDLARRIFLKLVVPAGDKDFVRNRIGLDTLLLGEDSGAVGRILDAFEQAKLLRRIPTADVGGEDRFEVAHETLIAYWPTLAAWLADARQGRETESKLIATARLWLDGGRADGYLITGDALEMFRDYRSDSVDVRQLLEASFKAKADREAAALKKRNWDWKIRILAVLSFVLIVLLFGWTKYNQKQEEERLVKEALQSKIQELTDKLEALQKAAAQGKSVDFKASLTSTLISDSAAQTAIEQLAPPSPKPPETGLADKQPALPQPVFDSATGDCIGFMWVGSAKNWKLKTPDGPEKLKQGPAVTNDDIYLRSDFPTNPPEYAMAVPYGVVPNSAPISILQIKPFLRDSGTQYWAKVAAPRKSCAKVNIQYWGPDEASNQLRKSLMAASFQLTYAPEKLTGAAGLSEIRYFFKEDGDLARAVADKVKEVNGNKPVTLRPLLSYVGTKPLVPGSLEAWVDLSPPPLPVKK